MSATDETSTAELAHEEKAALAAELFAPGVGAQAGPPTTPATATGSAGDTPPGAHSHGGPVLTGQPVPTGSPAERFTSTDPDAFPKPTGREEEWRFTPLRRARQLLDGAPSDARLQVDSDLPEGAVLTSVEAGDPLLKGLPEPVDRLAALTRQRSNGATVLRIAKEAVLDRPVTLRLSGTGSETSCGASWSSRSVRSRRRPSSSTTPAWPSTPAVRPSCSATVRS